MQSALSTIGENESAPKVTTQQASTSLALPVPPLLQQLSTVTVDLFSDLPPLPTDALQNADAVPVALPSPQAGLKRLVEAFIFTSLPPEENPLASLIQKYQLPSQNKQILRVQDVDGKPDGIAQLLNAGSWYALAEYARQKLLQTKVNCPSDIFELWYYRLTALIKKRFYDNALTERKFIVEWIDSETEVKTGGLEKFVIPFSFRVLLAMIPFMCSGDTNESIEALIVLLQQCRLEFSKTGASIWAEREVQIHILLADCLVKIHEYNSALAVLAPLRANLTENLELICSMIRIYLQIGNVEEASKLIDQVGQINSPAAKELVELNRALLEMAKGNWEQAAQILTPIMTVNPRNVTVINNLAVCQLYRGKLQESIRLLEEMLRNAVSLPTCRLESVALNLTTLYELSCERDPLRKQKLVDILVRHAGDNFDPSPLKL